MDKLFFRRHGKSSCKALPAKMHQPVYSIKTLILLLLFMSATSFGQSTWYSISTASTNANTLSNWKSNKDNTGSSPSEFNSTDIYIIQNGHIYKISTAWNPTNPINLKIETGGLFEPGNGVTLNSLIIETGATYEQKGGTLTVNNGVTGADLSVSGILKVTGTAVTLGASATAEFLGVSKFIWTKNPSPTLLATWSSTSTIEFTGVTSTVPSNLNQNFGNFTWDCPQTQNIQFAGALANVSGTLKIVNTGAYDLFLCNNTAPTINIGNLEVSGKLALTNALLGAPIVNIANNVTINAGGTLNSASVSSASTILNVNGNWSNAGTFNPGTGTVVFNGSSPQQFTRTGTGSFNNLTINNASGVTLLSNAQVSNNLVINPTATLTINSDAANSGSLIINGTSTGNITYNRYMSGVNQWHLISSPVSNQGIESFAQASGNAIAKNGVKYGVGPYDNNGVIGSTWSFWNETNISTAGNFSTGKGYQILRTSNGLVSFTGTTPTTTVTQNISVGTANAWNLIGNPFPAAIAANTPAQETNNFITVNSASLNASHVALYLWNPATSTYTVINHASDATHIAPGQGFFVKAISGGGTVDFTPAMRTHAASSFQRIAAQEIPSISLVAETSTGTKSSTYIKYYEGASLGLDPGYDAGRFGANSSSFGIYSKLVQNNGVDFALQVVPDNSFNTTIIPIGLDANAGTQVTFKASYTYLPLDTKVYLEDRLLGTYTELNATAKTYTVTLTSLSKGDGRFYLRTTPSITLSTKEQETLEIKIIPMYGSKRIKVSGPIVQPATFTVYDILGRLLFSEGLKKENNNEVSLPTLNNGIYIIKVTTAQQQFSAKIAWY